MSLDCRLVDVNSDIFTDILRLNSEVFPSNELVAPINLSNNIYANDENLSIFSFYKNRPICSFKNKKIPSSLINEAGKTATKTVFAAVDILTL